MGASKQYRVHLQRLKEYDQHCSTATLQVYCAISEATENPEGVVPSPTLCTFDICNQNAFSVNHPSSGEYPERHLNHKAP